MPNYTVTSGTTILQAGEEYGSTQVDLVITPASGYTIAPNNFVIGSATYDSDGDEWIGGNVSSIVNKVKFTQVQGESNVKASVYLSQAVFSEDSTLLIDIDESVDNPINNQLNGACLDVEYKHAGHNNASVTLTGLTDGYTTITTPQAGGSSQVTKKNVTRFKNDMVNDLMFTVLVNPNTNHSLINAPSVHIEQHVDSVGSFTWSTDLLSNGNGVVTVYYSETESSQSTAPCDLGNVVFIDYDVIADEVVTGNTIHGVQAMSNISAKEQFVKIAVAGDAGAQYTLQLKDVTNGLYYSWTTGTFIGGVQTKIGTIQPNGGFIHKVRIRRALSTRRVAVRIGASGSPSSTLATGVPQDDDDLVFTQFGFNQAAIVLHTDNVNKYGTLPGSVTVKAKANFDGDGYVPPKLSRLTLSGSTTGSSTSFKASGRIPRDLKPKMIVIGSGVPQDTTVISVSESEVVLSSAVNFSSSTPITFVNHVNELVGFYFTILPSTTTTSPNFTAIAPNTSFNSPKEAVYGFKSAVAATASTSQAGSTTLVVDNAKGYVPGQKLTGSFVTEGTKVVSIDYSTNTITLNQATNASTASEAITIQDNINPSSSIIDMKVEQSGVNVVVRGYIYMPKIDTVSGSITINLDEIITAS